MSTKYKATTEEAFFITIMDRYFYKAQPEKQYHKRIAILPKA